MEEENTTEGPQTGHAVLGEGCAQVMGISKRGLFTGGQVQISRRWRDFWPNAIMNCLSCHPGWSHMVL